MSIASKLEYLDKTKDYIRECIQRKGVTVSSGTTFRQYGDKILEIETEKHPPGWEGEGGGGSDSGSGNLTVGSALATGKDFVLSPPSGYDGFSSVNVIGDANLKPENIASGITIYGVTGTMELSSNMTKVPSEYESLFEEARRQWSGDYSGMFILESDEAVAFGFMLPGFTIENYDTSNTEFMASKWVYVAYNKKTKTWKVEDHTNETSAGNSYIKNIRYCDRYLYYKSSIIYPYFSDSGYTDGRGTSQYSVEVFVPQAQTGQASGGYYRALTFSAIFSGDYTIDWGDGTKTTGHVTSPSLLNYARPYQSEGTYTIVITGDIVRIAGATVTGSSSVNYNVHWGPYITKILTQYPYTVEVLNPIFTLGKEISTEVNDDITFSPYSTINTRCSVIPDNLLSKVPNVSSAKSFLAGGAAIRQIPANLLLGKTKIANIDGFAACCSVLEEIPSGIFDSLINVTDAAYCFSECITLYSIPNRLFANNTKLINVPFAFFKDSELVDVPSDIFEGCNSIRDMRRSFQETKIRYVKSGLIPSGAKLKNLSYMFYKCVNLLEVDGGLIPSVLDNSDLKYMFSGCGHLESVGGNLIGSGGDYVNLSYMFNECEKLTTIGGGLIPNGIGHVNLESMFNYCSSLLNIPSKLIPTGTKPINMSRMFRFCYALTKIPEDFFDGIDVSDLTTMDSLFYGCSNLRGKAPEIWNDPRFENISHVGVFYGCSNLSNYSEIPTTWRSSK